MNPQQAPRVVSKSRYLGYLSKKAILYGSGTLQLMFGGAAAVVCGVIAVMLFLSFFLFNIPGSVIVGFFISLLVGALSGFVAWLGSRQLKKADQLEPLVPLTRQNAEQLPAEQSLVRASSEPSEGQQTVLLRAAGSNTQTPPEELLRATAHPGDTSA